MYRTMGSLAFVAAARAVWAVTKDRDDNNRRLMLPVKNNLAPNGTGLAYKIVKGQLALNRYPHIRHKFNLKMYSIAIGRKYLVSSNAAKQRPGLSRLTWRMHRELDRQWDLKIADPCAVLCLSTS